MRNRSPMNPPSRWLLLLGVWLLYASFGLVATSLAPMAALIIADLEMSHAEMGLAMGAWQLAYIGAAVPSGILLDKIGARPALAIGGFLVALSALARGYAVDASTMVMAVMLFGLGGPIVSAGAPKVVVSNFEGSARGLAMGIYMTGPAIGGIVSLTATYSVLLPWLDQEWRSVMFLWAGVAVMASVIWFFLAGFGGSVENTSPATSGRSQVRVIGEMLSKPTVVIVLAMGLFVFLFNHGLNNWLPELLRSHGMSAVHAGYWAAIPTVIGIVGSLLIPGLATPERRFHIMVGLSIVACLASVLLRFNQDGLLLTGLLLQGIARSSLIAVLMLTLLELPEIGEKYAGVASGIFFSAAEIGGVLGPLLLGILYAPGTGFSAGLWLLTGVSMTMIVGSAWLQRQ